MQKGICSGGIEVMFCVQLSGAGIDSCTGSLVTGECLAVPKYRVNSFIIVS